MTWPVDLEVELYAELGTNEGVLWYCAADITYFRDAQGKVGGYLFPQSGANGGKGYGPLYFPSIGNEYLGSRLCQYSAAKRPAKCYHDVLCDIYLYHGYYSTATLNHAVNTSLPFGYMSMLTKYAGGPWTGGPPGIFGGGGGVGLVEKSKCDCRLVSGHELWCTEWKAY